MVLWLGPQQQKQLEQRLLLGRSGLEYGQLDLQFRIPELPQPIPGSSRDQSRRHHHHQLHNPHHRGYGWDSREEPVFHDTRETPH